MKPRDEGPGTADPPVIYVVSGGTGASGEQVVRTVLVQFPNSELRTVIVPHVRQLHQVEGVVEEAAQSGGTIVHTMVDPELRQALIRHAAARGVVALDLMGPLMSRLAEVLGQEPLSHPGLYRRLHRAYFGRVAAIEFAVAHDDGMNPHDWPQAEAVLLGVSRVGKTPLSMYLSVLGWKVANVPLVLELPTPPALFELDPRRVIGLSMQPDQLLFHRQQRRQRMHASGLEAYTDLDQIRQEVREAQRVFQRGGFSAIDVTDKPIETSADQIAELITRRFAEGSRSRPA